MLKAARWNLLGDLVNCIQSVHVLQARVFLHWTAVGMMWICLYLSLYFFILKTLVKKKQKKKTNVSFLIHQLFS